MTKPAPPALSELSLIALHGEHDEAELLAAHAAVTALPDEEIKLEGLLLCGEYYCNRQRLHEATRYFREAANQARKLHLWSALAHAQHWQAQIKLLQGEHLRALDIWLHSLDHAIDSDDDAAFIRAYTGIGQICFAYQQYEQALVYQGMACSLAERIAQPSLILAARLNLLSTLYRHGQYDAAEAMVSLIENQLSEEHNPTWHCECATYRGLIILERGDTKAALQALLQAQELNQHNGGQFSDALSSLGLGRTYLTLGQLDAAHGWLDRALTLSQGFPGLTLRLESHALLELLCERKQDFAGALAHHKQHHALQLGLLQKQVEHRLARISHRQLAPLEQALRLERSKLRYQS